MKELSFFEESEIESQLIFDGRVLHVYKDSIRLPNGKQSTREYCKHGGAVAVVPLTEEGKVVCVRQYRYALGRITLEIPAGKLDYPGEDRTQAAHRELREETGYRTDHLVSLGDLSTSPALLTEVISLYLAEHMTPGPQDPDDDEFLELLEIPLETLVDMILAGEVQDSKTQAAVLKVWAMKKKQACAEEKAGDEA